MNVEARQIIEIPKRISNTGYDGSKCLPPFPIAEVHHPEPLGKNATVSPSDRAPLAAHSHVNKA
jgi:hypothetical protein